MQIPEDNKREKANALRWDMTLHERKPRYAGK